MSSRKDSIRSNFAAAMRKRQGPADRSTSPATPSRSPYDRAESIKSKLLEEARALPALVSSLGLKVL
jgi:hypothetical protein